MLKSAKSTLNKWVHKSLPRWHFFLLSWVRDMVMAGLQMSVVHVGASESLWGRGKSHSYWLLCPLSPFLSWGDWAMLVSRGDFRGLFPNDSVVQEKKMLSERPVLKLCSCIILNGKHKWKLGYSLGGQGVWKGGERRQAMAMRECYWQGRWEKAKDLLGCTESPNEPSLAWSSQDVSSTPPWMTEDTDDK